MSNVQIGISRGFKRADPAVVNGHPLRGSLNDKWRDDVSPRRERIVMIRDTVILVMGAVSAVIPLVIAFQSITGA